MAGYGSWDDRPWERGEGERDWERWRRDRQQRWTGREEEGSRERGEEDLGARGREDWRGRDRWRAGEGLGRGEEWRERQDWRGADMGEGRRGGWRTGQRDEPGWRDERRASTWDPDRDRDEWRGRDWRPAVDRPWIDRPPGQQGRETRGLVEWEDRGPLAWLRDKLGGSRRPGRGPKGYTRSDERIHEDVCERIARSGVEADDIEVRVDKREVTLTGTVKDRHEKWWLEDLVDDVFGVEEVHNHLRVARHETGGRGEGTGPGLPH